MRAELLRPAAALVAALSAPNCLSIPPWQGAARFTGCFNGPISEPAGSGDLTIVLTVKDGTALEGCVVARDPAFAATFAGTVLQPDLTRARLTAMTSDATVTLLLLRRPPDAADAVTLDLTNETGSPFVRARDLPRCGTARTCEDLGIALPFMPGGEP